MSLGIINQMLETKQSAISSDKIEKSVKKKTYKELMKEELKKRRDNYLLRHPKKKSGIKKHKEWNSKLLNSHAKNKTEPTIVEIMEAEKRKSDESYKERIKVWKEEFKVKGKVASGVCISHSFVYQSQPNIHRSHL